MSYLVVFDTREVDYLSPSLGATALIVVLTAILLVLARKELDRRAGMVFSYLVIGLVGLGLAVTWSSTYREYSSAAAALDEGRTAVVQGRVSNFKATTSRGHEWERFCVEDKCFRYWDSGTSAGFNNTSSHGGPIKPGLPVRVTFVGNTIVKLEVAQ